MAHPKANIDVANVPATVPDGDRVLGECVRVYDKEP